uniref:Odorant receptor n=2 Tax=Holotrichia parallela TaxID=93412 RepID=A0A2P9JY47_HOLPA|nr:odorant receptor 6 [Holotrichia parallela]
MRNFVLNYSLKQLSLLCLYPDIKNLQFQIVGILVCCFYASAWIFNITGVIINFNGLDSIQQAMVSLPSAHQLLFKTVFMFFTKSKLAKVVRKINYLQSLKLYTTSENLRRKIEEADEKFNFYFKIYKRIILITSYIFITKPLLSRTRHFPIGWYTPCDINDNFCYATWYIWESVYVLFAQYTLASVDSLFFAIIFTMYVEVEKLKDYFQNIYVKDKIIKRINYREFCKSIDHHNYILKVLEEINDVFQYQLLNQFVTSIVTICFGIYYLNASYPPHLELIPYLLVYHNQLFMYCFAGEMIQRQITSIGTALYTSNWYCCKNKEFTACLKLIIQRSHRPINVNIGHIWKLDTRTFIGVMRTSLSIHTFLQTINKQ